MSTKKNRTLSCGVSTWVYDFITAFSLQQYPVGYLFQFAAF
ncbi:hypothetical protein [Flavobacterium sp. 3HN19-14]